MSRKGRLVFPGAIYHVINRGNYRRDLFELEETREAFEQCLFAACKKSAWLLHAFVVMRNHFHLALETPEGNLVAGMQWLQATFANRFNRFRDERGHLFQGRYKSLLVDIRGKTLGEVCDYIHLNPLNAGITDLAGLRDFRWSSFWYLYHKARRPAFLHPETALVRTGISGDDPAAWQAYAQHLARQVELLPHQHSNPSHQRRFERGWALGSEEFQQAMAERDHASWVSRHSGATATDDLKHRQWTIALTKALACLGRSETEAAAAMKSELWKLAVACWMRETTQASRAWLSGKLVLGTPQALSHNLAVFARVHRATDPDYARLKALYST